MSKGLSDARKIQVFSGLNDTRLYYGSWEQDLEAGRSSNKNLFKRGVFITSTNAIVEVAKVVQKEHEHIHIYASKFKGYCQFFKETLLEEALLPCF